MKKPYVPNTIPFKIAHPNLHKEFGQNMDRVRANAQHTMGAAMPLYKPKIRSSLTIVVSALDVEEYFNAVDGSWNRTLTVYDNNVLEESCTVQVKTLPVSKGKPTNSDCQ